MYAHEADAEPLHPELCYAEETGRALKRLELLAASDGGSRPGDGEDVGEACRAGCRTQEDEVRRYPFGGASRNDAVVLR